MINTKRLLKKNADKAISTITIKNFNNFIIVYSKLRVINGLCKIVIIITNIYTHSFIFPQSVWHENSYKDRRFKHCFGLSGPDFAAA